MASAPIDPPAPFSPDEMPTGVWRRSRPLPSGLVVARGGLVDGRRRLRAADPARCPGRDELAGFRAGEPGPTGAAASSPEAEIETERIELRSCPRPGASRWMAAAALLGGLAALGAWWVRHLGG